MYKYACIYICVYTRNMIYYDILWYIMIYYDRLWYIITLYTSMDPRTFSGSIWAVVWGVKSSTFSESVWIWIHRVQYNIYIYWLVVVSWDHEIPTEWKVINFMFQTTNQYICMYIYIFIFFWEKPISFLHCTVNILVKFFYFQNGNPSLSFAGSYPRRSLSKKTDRGAQPANFMFINLYHMKNTYKKHMS